MNAYMESAPGIAKWAKELSIGYTILAGGNGVAYEQYNVPDYPANYWIDRNGNLVAYAVGWKGPASVTAMEEQLEKLLSP